MEIQHGSLDAAMPDSVILWGICAYSHSVLREYLSEYTLRNDSSGQAIVNINSIFMLNQCLKVWGIAVNKIWPLLDSLGGGLWQTGGGQVAGGSFQPGGPESSWFQGLTRAVSTLQ